MSTIQIAHSPDLQKLREKGYNIQITDAGFLVVRDVPYVNKQREVMYDGILATDLELAGDITVRPERHVVNFVGEYPCDSEGKTLTILQHGSAACALGSNLVAQHSFSRKPEGGYVDYYHKMTAYAALLVKHAVVIVAPRRANTA